MRKYLFFLVAVFFVISGCDILDHGPYNNTKIEAFYNDLNTALQQINADDVSAVMAFYDIDYLHDLSDFYAREDFYLGLFQTYGDSLELQSSLLNYYEDYKIDWNLQINYENSDTSFTEIFEFEEQLINRDGDFLFYGNQVNPPELDPSKPVIFVEYGTSVGCGNCPPASVKLHEMGLEHGAQFIYISYCANEPANLYFDFASYYHEVAQPVTIFGGQYKVVGASPEDLLEFEQRYEQILAGTPEVFLSNITWNDNGSEIDGSVQVDLDGISTNDLFLRVALVDERAELFYFSGGSRIYNVIFAMGEEQISESGIKDFSFSYDLPSYADEMPPTTKLIFWLQTREASYNQNTCKIHTAAETKLF